jgi:hypothetical protein
VPLSPGFAGVPNPPFAAENPIYAKWRIPNGYRHFFC